MKDHSRIFCKHLLVLSVTVDNLARRRIDHFRHMVDESKYEHDLTHEVGPATMAVNGCFRGSMFSLRMSHFSFYLYHLRLPRPRQRTQARARSAFSENESRQSGSGAHRNHSRYPQRMVFEHTVWHDRYCRSVFHCDAWRVCMSVCVLFIVIHNMDDMYIHLLLATTLGLS